MQQNPYAPPVANAYPQDPSTIVEPRPKVSVIDSVKFAFSRQVGFGSLAMGLLLTFIPVVGPILLAGWMAESHRRLVRRESPSVRPFVFGEFVQYLTAGLVPFLVQLVVTLVAMMPMLVIVGIMVAIMVPMFTSGSDPNTTVVISMTLAVAIVVLVTMAVVGVVFTAMEIRAELSGNFSITFRLDGVRRFASRQWKPILGHSLLLGLISIPLLLLGLLVFLVGVYFASVALQFAQMHLRWQIYESDVRLGGEVLPVFPGNGADL